MQFKTKLVKPGDVINEKFIYVCDEQFPKEADRFARDFTKGIKIASEWTWSTGVAKFYSKSMWVVIQCLEPEINQWGEVSL